MATECQDNGLVSLCLPFTVPLRDAYEFHPATRHNMQQTREMLAQQ